MSFWRPETSAPGAHVHDRASEQDDFVNIRHSSSSRAFDRHLLPISKQRRQLLFAVETCGVTILVGETGCGKSTQVLQYLHEAGWTRGNFKVACTQPRRLAAISVAKRVAEEMGVELGQEVGYRIQFDDKTDPLRTRIQFMTDGMLLREMLMDPLLSRYSVIMVDEAHERSSTSDILIALLRYIRSKRPDLRIIISSANLEANLFYDFFNSELLTPHKLTLEEFLYSDASMGNSNDLRVGRAEETDQIETLRTALHSSKALPHDLELPDTDAGLISHTIAPLEASENAQLPTIDYATSAGFSSLERKRGRVSVGVVSQQSQVSHATPPQMSNATAQQPRRSRWDKPNSSTPLSSSSEGIGSDVTPLQTLSADTAITHGRTPDDQESLTKALIAIRDIERKVFSPPTPKEPVAGYEAPEKLINLKTATVLAIPGRTYPIDVHYTVAPVADFVEAAVETALEIHQSEPPGDILIFLPGVESIDRCCDMLAAEAHYRKTKQSLPSVRRGFGELDIFPLHAQLSVEDQNAALEESRVDVHGEPVRKIVVATNVAETSITIDNIAFVIDSGMMNLPLHHPGTGLSALVTVPISKANANQRAGRAGRMRRGKCYRLYTENFFAKLLPSLPPDITRMEFSHTLLLLLSLRITNPVRFHYVEPPSVKTLSKSIELLLALNAILPSAIEGSNIEGVELCPVRGQAMADMPLDPKLSAMIIASFSLRCFESVITICAMTQIKGLFLNSNPRKVVNEKESLSRDSALRLFGASEGDHLTYLNIYNQFEEHGYNSSWCSRYGLSYRALQRARSIREQLRAVAIIIFQREKYKGTHFQETGDVNSDASSVIRKISSRQSSEGNVSSQDNARGKRKFTQVDTSNWTLDSAQIQGENHSTESIRKCILTGCILQVAKWYKEDMYYTLREGHLSRLHPSSVLHLSKGQLPRYILYGEATWTVGSSTSESAYVGYSGQSVGLTSGFMLRDVSAISAHWILELAPHIYQQQGGWMGGKEKDYLSDVKIDDSDVIYSYMPFLKDPSLIKSDKTEDASDPKRTAVFPEISMTALRDKYGNTDPDASQQQARSKLLLPLKNKSSNSEGLSNDYASNEASSSVFQQSKRFKYKKATERRKEMEEKKLQDLVQAPKTTEGSTGLSLSSILETAVSVSVDDLDHENLNEQIIRKYGGTR